MMFFRSVGAVFRGVSAFPEFAKRNPFRALFHLLMFCFFLSLICSGIQTAFAAGKIDLSISGLKKQFGKIQVSEKGILPEKNQKLSWSFYFPGNIRLDYIAPEEKFLFGTMDEWKQKMGIFWARRGFMVWMRPDPSGKLYYMMPFVTTKEMVEFLPSKKMILTPVSANEVAKELDRYQEVPKVEKVAKTSYEFATVGKLLKGYIYAVFAFSSLFGNFLLTLILILMFAGLQALWKAQGLESLKFGGTLSLLCYAAFPAVAARMLLESFSLPGIGEIVFFALFFIYQMIAFHEVRRTYSGTTGFRDGSEN
jgi:hypothetical protein